MKIRMKVYVSGTHDGEDWPPIGGVVDVDDEFGAEMCANGAASPVADKDADVEKAVVDDDLDELRAAATAAGVKVDKRWGTDRLREELAAATGTDRLREELAAATGE